MSALLVRGDLEIAATCTVTYVDPHQVLACGHPITRYGNVSIPMTKADVVTTLASPLNSFKIVNTTQTIGAFTEDRSSAIRGVLGRICAHDSCGHPHPWQPARPYSAYGSGGQPRYHSGSGDGFALRISARHQQLQ